MLCVRQRLLLCTTGVSAFPDWGPQETDFSMEASLQEAHEEVSLEKITRSGTEGNWIGMHLNKGLS